MTDENIIKMLFCRKEEAIDKLIQKYGAYCYKIAYGILNDREDSEECLNDTWFEVWESIPPNNPTPERNCNIFIRRYFYVETVKEISKRYHISENNVSVILNRCRKKLKLYLEKEGYIL